MECCICSIDIKQLSPLYPCGHSEFCSECVLKLKECPLCLDLTCKLQTFVMPGGTIRELQVDSTSTCHLLKKLLAPLVGITTDEFQFVCGGRVIGDSTIIEPGKSLIFIVLNLRGD